MGLRIQQIDIPAIDLVRIPEPLKVTQKLGSKPRSGGNLKQNVMLKKIVLSRLSLRPMQ